jgi:hypothetical protein
MLRGQLIGGPQSRVPLYVPYADFFQYQAGAGHLAAWPAARTYVRPSAHARTPRAACRKADAERGTRRRSYGLLSHGSC